MLSVIRVAAVLVAISSSVLGQINQPAPRLTLKNLQRRAVRLSDYKGKVVLLNFWATWCAPCRAEMPELIKWQHEYGRRGLQVIGVTYPPMDLAEVDRFIRDIKVNYPILVGDEKTKARFDKGETLPLTVVIDQKGRVREMIRGIIYPEEFEEKILPLLSPVSPLPN